MTYLLQGGCAFSHRDIPTLTIIHLPPQGHALSHKNMLPPTITCPFPPISPLQRHFLYQRHASSYDDMPPVTVHAHSHKNMSTHKWTCLFSQGHTPSHKGTAPVMIYILPQQHDNSQSGPRPPIRIRLLPQAHAPCCAAKKCSVPQGHSSSQKDIPLPQGRAHSHKNTSTIMNCLLHKENAPSTRTHLLQ